MLALIGSWMCFAFVLITGSWMFLVPQAIFVLIILSVARGWDWHA